MPSQLRLSLPVSVWRSCGGVLPALIYLAQLVNDSNIHQKVAELVLVSPHGNAVRSNRAIRPDEGLTLETSAF